MYDHHTTCRLILTSDFARDEFVKAQPLQATFYSTDIRPPTGMQDPVLYSKNSPLDLSHSLCVEKNNSNDDVIATPLYQA